MHTRSCVMIAALAALPLAGCLTYGAREYSAMSAYDLCELRHYQSSNLTAASRSQLDQELKRRNEDCSGLLPEIRKDREFDRYDRMYNRQSP